MKEIGKILISILIGVLIVVIAMSILGRMNRSVEVESVLSNAVESSLRQVVEGQVIRENEELVADCIIGMVTAMDTDSSLTVEVMQADVEKGVLSICAFETFQYLNGKEGKTIPAERTVIWNRVEEASAKTCEITFFLSKESLRGAKDCYKKVVVKEGERISAPINPLMVEKRFLCWKDINDYVADFSLPVQQDLVYYAEWE